MGANATEKKWAGSNLTERASRGLIADVAGYLSSEYRAERKKQKMREDLVRVYIEGKKQEPSLLLSVVGKLVKTS